MAEYKYFTEAEFGALTPSCSLSDMDETFMRRLDFVRELTGQPLYVNCAYRSSEWDKEKGRSGNSYHCKGLAVDVRCKDSKYRARLVAAAVVAGILGIGVYPNFIHLDGRQDPCMFLGFTNVERDGSEN